MTIAELKTRLTSKIHGASLNKIRDIYGLIYEAAGNVLAKMDPTETQRVIPITLDVNAYYYNLPTDLKNDKIINLRPITTITVEDSLTPLLGVNLIYNETPTGTINGVNVTFATAQTPVEASLRVYVDGVRLGTDDWSLSGSTITLTVAPSTAITVDYEHV